MAEIREGQLSELIPDDKNMNRHTPYGMSLIEKSIRENGLGRSILVDKDNRIIGGNGVVETAAAVGMEDTIVVETTGDKLVVVKRMDVSLDSKRGRSMAMADNATALADIDWDVETVKEVAGEWGVEPQDWGVVVDESALYSDEVKLPEGDKAPVGQMTFYLANEQMDTIKDAISEIQHSEEFKYIETFGNANGNGNAIYLIVKQWADARK